MKKLLYIVLAAYTVLHIVVFTHYPVVPGLSEGVSTLAAIQWLIPTLLLVLLVPAFEKVKLPIRLITVVGLVFVAVCIALTAMELSGLWWSWSTLGFLVLVVLLVLNETKLLSLSLAVVFLGFGSWEIIYQVGLWFYHDFFGGDLSNLLVVVAENLCWIVPSMVTILVLQRRYKVFKHNLHALLIIAVSVTCTCIWFINKMDTPLLWWKGQGPFIALDARPLFISISRASQAFWLLGAAALFASFKREPKKLD